MDSYLGSLHQDLLATRTTQALKLIKIHNYFPSTELAFPEPFLYKEVEDCALHVLYASVKGEFVLSCVILHRQAKIPSIVCYDLTVEEIQGLFEQFLLDAEKVNGI